MDVSKEKGISTAYGPESPGDSGDGEAFEPSTQGALARKLQGRHMQMIAIGGSSMRLFHIHSTLNISPLQVAPLVLVFSWAQARLLSTAVPAVW